MFIAKGDRESRRGDASIDLSQALARGEAVWHKTGPVFSRLFCVSQPITEAGKVFSAMGCRVTKSGATGALRIQMIGCEVIETWPKQQSHATWN